MNESGKSRGPKRSVWYSSAYRLSAACTESVEGSENALELVSAAAKFVVQSQQQAHTATVNPNPRCLKLNCVTKYLRDFAALFKVVMFPFMWRAGSLVKLNRWKKAKDFVSVRFQSASIWLGSM